MVTYIVGSNESKQEAATGIHDLPSDKVWKIEIKEYRDNRTSQQNRLMWKWMRHISQEWAAATGEFHSPESWKEAFQHLFLGGEVSSIGDLMFVETKGTSDNNTKEFSAFLGQIEHWCVEKGIALPHPDDMYFEAVYGAKRGY